MALQTSRRIVSLVFSIAWKGAIVLFGVSVLVGINAKEEAAPRKDMSAPATGPVVTTSESGKVTIVVGAECEELMSELSILSRDGKELVNIHVFKGGGVEFTAGKNAPVRARGMLTAPGVFGFDVVKESSRFSLQLCADGSASADFVDCKEQTHRGFRVSPDGIFSPESLAY
jgi:hypothetical protein